MCESSFPLFPLLPSLAVLLPRCKQCGVCVSHHFPLPSSLSLSLSFSPRLLSFSLDASNMEYAWVNPWSLFEVGAVYKYDVSAPLPLLYQLVEDIRTWLHNVGLMGLPNAPVKGVIGYGHVGDGNLHLNIMAKAYTDEVTRVIEPYIYECIGKWTGMWMWMWMGMGMGMEMGTGTGTGTTMGVMVAVLNVSTWDSKACTWCGCGNVRRHEGSISAEHGLGQVKQDYLGVFQVLWNGRLDATYQDIVWPTWCYESVQVFTRNIG